MRQLIQHSSRPFRHLGYGRFLRVYIQDDHHCHPERSEWVFLILRVIPERLRISLRYRPQIIGLRHSNRREESPYLVRPNKGIPRRRLLGMTRFLPIEGHRLSGTQNKGVPC